MIPARWRFVSLVPALLAVFVSCAPHRTVEMQPPPAVPASQGAVPVDPQQTWVLKGILRQVGNFPHIEMVISGQSELFGKGDYYVIGPLLKELAALPPGKIAVKGNLLRKELELAGSSGRKRIRLEVEVTEYLR